MFCWGQCSECTRFHTLHACTLHGTRDTDTRTPSVAESHTVSGCRDVDRVLSAACGCDNRVFVSISRSVLHARCARVLLLVHAAHLAYV